MCGRPLLPALGSPLVSGSGLQRPAEACTAGCCPSRDSCGRLSPALSPESEVTLFLPVLARPEAGGPGSGRAICAHQSCAQVVGVRAWPCGEGAAGGLATHPPCCHFLSQSRGSFGPQGWGVPPPPAPGRQSDGMMASSFQMMERPRWKQPECWPFVPLGACVSEATWQVCLELGHSYNLLGHLRRWEVKNPPPTSCVTG